jgi:hypothetical protein
MDSLPNSPVSDRSSGGRPWCVAVHSPNRSQLFSDVTLCQISETEYNARLYVLAEFRMIKSLRNALFVLLLGFTSLGHTQVVSLEDSLVAVAGDPAAMQAVIDAELAAGNADGLAIALSKAASTLALTDTGAAAALMTQAITVSASASVATQSTVGAVASAVATTAAETGDAASAAAVTTAVESSGGAAENAYADSGGSSGSNVQTSNAVVQVQSTPTPPAAPPPAPSEGDTAPSGGDDLPPPPPPPSAEAPVPPPIEPPPESPLSPVS